jgi:hypothetical protein
VLYIQRCASLLGKSNTATSSWCSTRGTSTGRSLPPLTVAERESKGVYTLKPLSTSCLQHLFKERRLFSCVWSLFRFCFLLICVRGRVPTWLALSKISCGIWDLRSLGDAASQAVPTATLKRSRWELQKQWLQILKKRWLVHVAYPLSIIRLGWWFIVLRSMGRGRAAIWRKFCTRQYQRKAISMCACIIICQWNCY